MALSMNSGMQKLLTALVIIVAVTALAPTIFDNIDSLAGGTTPDWVQTLLTVIGGVGVVFIVWRAID